MQYDFAGVFKTMVSGNSNSVSEALVIDRYSLSIIGQPPAQIPKDDPLNKYMDPINTALKQAQVHAQTWHGTVLPAIIGNMAAIQNFLNIHQGIQNDLPTDPQAWKTAISVLVQQAGNCANTASDTSTALKSLSGQLSTDSGSFAGLVSDMNTFANGKDGILADLNSELDAVERKIHALIAADTVSCLMLVGGAILAGVGAFTDIISAGATTPVVMGGVAMAVTGAGGVIASSIAIHNALEAKASILSEETEIKNEVKLASSIRSTYNLFSENAGNASDAADSMYQTWTSLNKQLNQLEKDLNDAKIDGQQAAQYLFGGINKEIEDALNTIQTIQTQMAGVSEVQPKKNQTIQDAIVEAAQAQAA